jgi:DNA helicase-2/ATP-dependent DNA helicase PcrA
MIDISSLNEAQQQAVKTIDGALLIIAGAGAGKTKTITYRIAHIIDEGVRAGSGVNVEPKNILAITFTNKAAAEMRHRAMDLLPANITSVPMIATFHSFCVKILREYAPLVGRSKTFTIMDEDDAKGLLKEIIEGFGLEAKQWEPRKIKSIISREKNNNRTWADLKGNVTSQFETQLVAIWERYERLCIERNTFDFDDLLIETVRMFRENKNVLEKFQNLYTYIHVDEYQDTNKIQYSLIDMLADKHKNLCVVGDSDQTIYTWRGARIENILRFEQDYPNAQVIRLEQNYRSTKNIIDAANAVIENNKLRQDKTLCTSNEGGDSIKVATLTDEKREAEFCVMECIELIDKGVKPDDIAILYRANFQSRSFEEMFLRHHVPYKILGTKFYDRREVKDVLSYMRAAFSPESLHEVRRVINIPARGIGKVTIVKLFSGQRDELPAKMQIKINQFYETLKQIKEFAENNHPNETINFILKTTGLEEELKTEGEEGLERLQNIRELASVSTAYNHLDFTEAHQALLEDAALLGDQDDLKDTDNGVRLMTIHASKGLEFPYVFIVGLEHGIFPSERDGKSSKDEKEEERRLFYVAITRAKKRVFLTTTEMRMLYGERRISVPSEFIYEIPENLIEYYNQRHEGSVSTFDELLYD